MPWECVSCNCGIRREYKALSMRTYGVLFLSIAYHVHMNGVYFASMAYVLCTNCVRTTHLALLWRCRCVGVKYLQQHDDRRQKTYIPLFVRIRRSGSVDAPWAWPLWRHNAFLVTCLTALEKITAVQCAQSFYTQLFMQHVRSSYVTCKNETLCQ